MSAARFRNAFNKHIVALRLLIVAGLGACCLLAPVVEARERAYVSNEDGHSVTVIDTVTNEVIATVPVGKRPRGLKVSRDGARLYVAVSGMPKCPPTMPDEECAKRARDLEADGIAVVDTTTFALVSVLRAGSDPEQFDLSGDGTRLYVANEDTATLTVLDVASGEVIKRIGVGREPEGVVTSPDGKWVLVTNESDNSVSMVDTERLAVTRTVQVGKRPRGIAFTPDSRQAYVTGEFDASVYRFDVSSDAVAEKVIQLRNDARPMSVVLDQSRNRLYVSTGRVGTVGIIDLAGQPKLVSEVAVGARPWGIVMSKDGRTLVSANGPSDDVTVLDLTTLEAVRRIPVGRFPWGVVLGPQPRTTASY